MIGASTTAPAMINPDLELVPNGIVTVESPGGSSPSPVGFGHTWPSSGSTSAATKVYGVVLKDGESRRAKEKRRPWRAALRSSTPSSKVVGEARRACPDDRRRGRRCSRPGPRGHRRSESRPQTCRAGTMPFRSPSPQRGPQRHTRARRQRRERRNRAEHRLGRAARQRRCAARVRRTGVGGGLIPRRALAAADRRPPADRSHGCRPQRAGVRLRRSGHLEAYAGRAGMEREHASRR